MKNLKASKKRFSGGGEAEDKETGLEASKSEPVGFFERLRMGNIDDPKSEAYKRLGAGRGAAKRAADVEVIDATPVATRSLAEPKVEMPEAPRRTASRSAENVAAEDAGELSLAELAMVEPKGKSSASNKASPVSAARKIAPPAVKKIDIAAIPVQPRVAMGKMQDMPEKRSSEDDTSLSLAQRMARRKERMGTSKPTDERSVNQRFKEEFGLKKGGSVSASRGDGIAQRGKTKGRIY